MHNDPELNGKYLGTITRNFVKVADTLKEAAYQIRKRKLSDYPIFVFSQVEVPLGVLLINKYDLEIEWNIYASYLDEFLQRKLVDPEREQDFRQAYKDPEEFCCLFVVDEEFTSFVFVPYPED